jgi:exonuclease SbcD
VSGPRVLRIAQFSDLHYGPRHLAEADRCFAAAIDRAIALGVDAAVISGDATDHALDLHAPAALRLITEVRRLADHCPVLMLQGTWSHEPPGTLALFRLLGARWPVHVADRIAQVVLLADGRWWTPGARSSALDTLSASAGVGAHLPEGARALFSCLPSVNKAAVAAVVGAAAAGPAVGEHLAMLLQGLAPGHRVARRQGVPSVVASHGTVFGCVSEHGVPMAGFDHEFTTGALFAAGAQAVMLGHIHRHQTWVQDGTDGRQCIAYPGSIGRFHHGEQGDKGFLVWELTSEGACCRLEPTPARRTMDILFEGRPDLEALRTAVEGQDLTGVAVRVRWTVADEDRHEVDRSAIQGILQGASELRLEGRVVPVLRTRSPGIAQRPNLADKVRAWAECTEVRPEPMLACLERILGTEPMDIVAALVGAVEDAGDSAAPPTGEAAVVGALPLEAPVVDQTLDRSPQGEPTCNPCC